MWCRSVAGVERLHVRIVTKCAGPRQPTPLNTRSHTLCCTTCALLPEQVSLLLRLLL